MSRLDWVTLNSLKLPARIADALKGITGDAFNECVRGFEQLASATKRTEDVAMNLDKLLAAGLVPELLHHFSKDVLQKFSGIQDDEAAKEALYTAACSALGELVWTRDCAPEARPVVLEEGGMRLLSELIEATPSERLRLKALVVCRRMLYEVGSTARMDSAAIQAASDCNLVECLMGLLTRVVDNSATTVTIDTLEAVTYLLQRMMVCLEPKQKEQLHLAEYLESAATVMVSHLHEAANSGSDSPDTQRAIRSSLLAIRELTWDDHNGCIQPGLGAMAAAGAFEAVAGLMSPINQVAEGAKSQIPEEAKIAKDSPPLARGLLSGGTLDLACALLDKLAAVPESVLPEQLAALVPRMMHSVIAALVAQLDGRYSPGEGAGGHDDVAARQERALSALRKLLVIENSEFVPPAAVEAADAEGVPACLRKLALSCPEFVGRSASISATVGVSGQQLSSGTGSGKQRGSKDGEDEQKQVCCAFPTAVAAAALLADLTASSALAAAANGQPAQAASELQEVEAVVTPLISHAETDQSACRNFCYALYQLSLVQYADQTSVEGASEDEEDSQSAAASTPVVAESLSAPGAVARAALRMLPPPDEEQYALTSELVTLGGRVADGLNGLLAGGGCGEMRPHSKTDTPNTKASRPAHSRSQSSESVFSGGGEHEGISVLSRLQRVTQLIHELMGLRPAMGSAPISKHNLDALFIHGTMLSLKQEMDVYYTGLRVWLKVRKEAREAQKKELEAKMTEEPPQVDRVVPERPITAYLEKPPPSTLLALLHHETGVLELFKELVRDVPDARIRLRDIGALSSFARMLNENRRDNLLVSLQFNLARSEAIHPALKQAGCVALMECVLMEPPCGDGAQYDVRQLLALCTLGLVAGEDVGARFSQANTRSSTYRDGSSVAVEGGVLKSNLKDGSKPNPREQDSWAIRAVGLLESFDMADLMQRVMRDACRDGKYIISSSTSAWPFMLEPAALTVQCLARCDAMARRLAENKIPAMLISALGNKHGCEPGAALCISRALLNFARLPDLRQSLLNAGCVDALEPLTFSDNLCTSDAAKGCLLYVGELPDAAARSALQGSTPEALAPVLQAPLLPSSGKEGAGGGGGGGGEGGVRPSLSGATLLEASPEEEDERRLSSFMTKRAAPMSRRGSSLEAAMAAISSTGSTEPVVDVLISYKRRDALSFAFMLHTALVLRGVGCLLDYEYKPDLSDVEQVVARCRNLLLILTDEVLNSERCLQELEAAARHSVHVVIVVKEGARWGDASGNMLSYPPHQTIRALKPAVQTLFSLKAAHHREEHYGYFVMQLMKRLKRAQPAAPPMPSRKVRQSQAGGLPPGGLPSPPAGEPPRKPRHSSLGLPISVFADTQQLQGSESGAKSATPRTQIGPSGDGGTLSTAHSAALDGISSEVSALRQMLALGAGQQQAIQSLQADIALVRREVVAEVVASTRHVASSLTGEMATMLQQVKGSIGNEANSHANSHANMLAALKAEMTSAVQAATSAVRVELGQEMSLNMRHLAADVAELRQSMATLLSQQQQPHFLDRGNNNLAITSMPNLNGSLSPDPSAASFLPKQSRSAESKLTQPHPPPYPPLPNDPMMASSFGMPSTGHDLSANALVNGAALSNGLASTAPANTGTGSLLPPLTVNAGGPHGVASPPQHQARNTLPKTVAGTRDLPHTLLGNGGGVSPVGSMTPNVGGFAGPRLLAAQQQQYQQQRVMQVAAARSKGVGMQH